MAKKIELTPRQIEALLWAISLAEASYEGWTDEEMGRQTIQDLCRLEDVYNKLTATN